MIVNQAFIFIIFIVIGAVIGILFDIFRVLRKIIKTKDSVTYIQDILFCLITGCILLYGIFKFNHGEIRIYMFISIIIGVFFYILTISKYFIKLSVLILNKIIYVTKKIFSILLIPLNYIYNLIHKIFKPISFIIINVRKILSNLKIKIIKKSKKNVKKFIN